jgi:hypothetical protein
MAESAPDDFGADPLNLMRVMPTQGARGFSHAFFLRMVFLCCHPEQSEGPHN